MRIASHPGGGVPARQPSPDHGPDQTRSDQTGPNQDQAWTLQHSPTRTKAHPGTTVTLGRGKGASPFSSPSAPLTTGLCLFRGSASDTPAHNEPPPSPLGQVTHPLPAIPTAKGKGQSVSVDCAHHPICWVITAQSPLKGGLTPSLALSAPKAPPSQRSKSPADDDGVHPKAPTHRHHTDH
ncbi:hypothetical protein LZ32DRAFT_68453 [Colletotrichum eremochloae]|nr:hypothetical protein LZ32DRAFT_68453 [Colletotrichum eremochloae]